MHRGSPRWRVLVLRYLTSHGPKVAFRSAKGLLSRSESRQCGAAPTPSCRTPRQGRALAVRQPTDTDPSKFLPTLIGSDVLDEVLADTDRPEKNQSGGKSAAVQRTPELLPIVECGAFPPLLFLIRIPGSSFPSQSGRMCRPKSWPTWTALPETGIFFPGAV